jgi:surfactin synthase thioesterase subunit
MQRRARVFCCPYAGGSSLAYQQWSDIDPEIEVIALDYPGRLVRDDEPLLRSIGELVPWMFEEIAPKLDLPYSLVGSSLGGIVAFELARMAEARGCPPSVVVLCACAAPSRLRGRTSLTSCDDASFVEGISARYGGLIGAIANDPEICGKFLPLMRADIETFEGYEGGEAAPIHTDIIAVRGEDDRAVRFADIAPWRHYSTGTVSLMSVVGDHFFVAGRPTAIFAELSSRLKFASSGRGANYGR